MTENLPAVRQPAAAPAKVDTDSWVEMLPAVAQLAEQIHGTDFVPKGLRGSSAATAAAILYGREIGAGPMTSLANIAVIEGKPSVSAEHLRAMVLAAGHEIVYTELSGAGVTVKGRRVGSSEWTSVSWNLDMARAAGIAGKQVWQRYPRAMLAARATAELCRLIFPDVTHGLMVIEEAEDLRDGGAEESGGASGASPAKSATRTVRRQGASGRRTKAAGEAEADPSPAAPETGSRAGVDTGEPRRPAPALEPPERPSAATEPPEVPIPVPGAEPATAAPVGVAEGELDPPGPNDPPQDDRIEDEDRPHPVDPGQVTAMQMRFRDLGIEDREAKLHVISRILSVGPISSSKELTRVQATTVLNTLQRTRSREQLIETLDALDRQQVSEGDGSPDEYEREIESPDGTAEEGS